MKAIISKHLEHGDVTGLGPRLLENLARKGCYNCICGEDWIRNLQLVLPIKGDIWSPKTCSKSKDSLDTPQDPGSASREEM